jgi:hypothetical protein
MPIYTMRPAILSLLAAMLLSLTISAPASAEAGPFWYHRAAGEKGEGTKIEPKAPENLSGSGPSIILTFELVGEKLSVEAKQGFQVKSAIFNGVNQGQIKTELVFKQPVLVSREGEAKGCNVAIGEHNTVIVKGHLAWKWNGEKKQLEEAPASAGQKPDLIFTPLELPVQKPETSEVNLANSIAFTTLTLTGSGCGAFAGTFTVDGSEAALIGLSVGEFSKELGVRTIANESKEPRDTFLQHFWNGTANLGAVIGLVGASNPAALETQVGLTTAQQEIAVKEK